ASFPETVARSRQDLRLVRPAGLFRWAFSFLPGGNGFFRKKSGKQKSGAKPRFLGVAMCRRSIRGRQSINDCLLARLYDGNTTALPVSLDFEKCRPPPICVV